MSDLPPPPGERISDSLPSNARKKGYPFLTALVLGSVAVTLGWLVYVGTTPAAKVSGEKTQTPIDALTERAMIALDDGTFEQVRAEIQQETGCIAVTGGRMTVDTTDEAAVAEEARQRKVYTSALGHQGIQAGHASFASGPHEVTHQVIGWRCPSGTE